MPMTGPAPLRDTVAPYFDCYTSLRWSRNAVRRDSPFGDHRKYGASKQDEITISISHPEGVVLDAVGHAHRLPNLSGRYCLVVVLWKKEEQQWQRWQFFHVRIASDSFDAGDGTDACARPLEFVAEYVEFDSYTSATAPACVPEVLGRVDFHCGALHIPCMTYNMLTNAWRMTPYSDTGIRITHGAEQTNLPYCMWDEPMVSATTAGLSTFSLMQPRVIPINAPVSLNSIIDPSDYLGVSWQRRLFFSLQRGTGMGDAKNILLLHHGIALETNGSPEPIEAIEQNELLAESTAVFRVIDRVYATIGHDIIAVPAVFYNQVPLSTNLFFKLGDTILDDQGWWNLADPNAEPEPEPSEI